MTIKQKQHTNREPVKAIKKLSRVESLDLVPLETRVFV
jgi:hypothetical protein